MVSARKTSSRQFDDHAMQEEDSFWHRFSQWIYGETPGTSPQFADSPASTGEGDADRQTIEAQRAAAALEHLERQRRVRVIRP